MSKSRTSASFFWETLGQKQSAMKRAIEEKTVVFAHGCAGTGKTLVATYTALDLLTKDVKNGGVSKIIVSRPTVVAGEELGFLPGTLDDKISPFLRPIIELIKDSNHPDTQELLTPRHPDAEKQIEGVAISMMRGATFHNSIVLVDECQNLTKQQFEMMLTRIGHNCRMVFTGDLSQTDLPNGASGFKHAMDLMQDDPDVYIVEFGPEDVKRSDFVGRVIKKYAEDRQDKSEKLRSVA